MEQSKIKKKLLNDGYYSKNRDKIAVQHKSYRQSNKDYIQATKSLYYFKNKSVIKNKYVMSKLNKFNQ